MMEPRLWTAIMLMLLLYPAVLLAVPEPKYGPQFDGDTAFVYLEQQCSFGPRPPGSLNLSLCRQFIKDHLEAAGWNVTLQNFTYLEVQCSNIVARWGNGAASFILGAHYDTRPRADNDPYPGNQTKPVMGANDAASGTAILMQLAESLPNQARASIEMVFFDAEDSGYINGWSWIVGSSHYVDQLNETRRSQTHAMILLDMVGDKDLRLLRETSSTRSIQDAVWETAASLGHDDIFLDSNGGSITDDHRPFLGAGIPALDIIQHAPFPSSWHTVEDTPDKCSAESLDVVGDVVETFMVESVESSSTFALDPADVLVPMVIVALIVGLPVVCYGLKRRAR